jgi:hypothetical protein
VEEIEGSHSGGDEDSSLLGYFHLSITKVNDVSDERRKLTRS